MTAVTYSNCMDVTNSPAAISLLVGKPSDASLIRIQRMLVDVRSVHNSDTEMLVSLDVPGAAAGAQVQVSIQQEVPQAMSRKHLDRGHRRLDSFTDTGVYLVVSLGDESQRFPLAAHLTEVDLDHVRAAFNRPFESLQVVIPKKSLGRAMTEAVTIQEETVATAGFDVPVFDIPCPTNRCG